MVKLAQAGCDVHVGGADEEGVLEAAPALPKDVKEEGDGGGQVLLEEAVGVEVRATDGLRKEFISLSCLRGRRDTLT